MAVWLHIQGDPHAHLYPDNENDTVAACGHDFIQNCPHCGTSLRSTKNFTVPKCPKCLEAEPTYDLK